MDVATMSLTAISTLGARSGPRPARALNGSLSTAVAKGPGARNGAAWLGPNEVRPRDGICRGFACDVDRSRCWRRHGDRPRLSMRRGRSRNPLGHSLTFLTVP